MHGGEESETVHSEHLSVDGRIILKWALKKWNGAGAGFVGFRIGTGGRLL